MAFSATVIRILLASPSDVEEERDNVHAFINEWNVSYTLSEKVVLWPVNWDSLVAQDTTGDLSDENSSQIIDDCDILIGIFWTRTDENSGSVTSLMIDKMEKFIKTGKPSLLYFSTQPISPDSIDPHQYALLRGFKEKAKQRGSVYQYSTSDELMSMVSKHMLAKIRDIHEEIQAIKPERSTERASMSRQTAAEDTHNRETPIKKEDKPAPEDTATSKISGGTRQDASPETGPDLAEETSVDMPLAEADTSLIDEVVDDIELDDGESSTETTGASYHMPRTAGAGKKPDKSTDAEMVKIKKKYVSELSHLEVEWIVERDGGPDGIKDGKSILDQVRHKLMDFQIAIQRRVDEEKINRLLDLINSAREIQNHQLLADGGKSYDSFWKKGNEIFQKYKEFTDSL